MTFTTKLIATAAALALSAGVAFAQTPAPAPATPAAPAAKAPAATAPAKKGGKKEATTPWGIECSAKADEAGLKGKGKGKERKAFRDKCVREYKKSHKAQ